MTIIQFVRTYYPFQISLKNAKDVIDFVARYEIYSDNAEAFNTPYLAVKYPIFLQSHAQSIFDIFNVYKPDFEKKLKEVPTINKNFNTISDSFNLFCVILAHKFVTSSLPAKTATDGFRSIMKLMCYKFFSGSVRSFFKFKANEGTMSYTLDHLSLKSSIKQEDMTTWRLVIESHVGSMLETTSPHYQVFRTFSPDEKVYQIISDMSTRLRQKIALIAEDYYENVKAGNTILSTNSRYDEVDDEGEAELRVIKSMLDNKLTSILGKCVNINTLMNFAYVDLIAKMSNGIRPDMMRNMLVQFSDMCVTQEKNHDDTNIMKEGGKEIYVGYRILMNAIVQRCYRHCILSGVNMEENLSILKCVGDIFRASRLSDEGLLTVKESVDYFIRENLTYKREATQVSLRNAFIQYIILLTFV